MVFVLTAMDMMIGTPDCHPELLKLRDRRCVECLDIRGSGLRVLDAFTRQLWRKARG